MTFGEVEKGFMAGVSSDEKTSFAMLDRAVDQGVSFLDTANVYGNGLSEEILGRWLKKQGTAKRDKLVIATKFRMAMGEGPNDRGGSRLHVMQQVDASLRRLQLDAIDLYQMHAQDRHVPIEETLGALDDLVRAGKVRAIGCSNFTGERLVESLWVSDKRNLARFVSLQPNYNLVQRNIEMELLPACRRFGLGVIAWSPLARGFLSGKYSRNTPPPSGTRLASWQDSFRQVDKDRHWATLDELRAVAKELGTSPSRVALAWVLAQPGVTSVIVGARDVAQLDENLGADALSLPAELLARLDKASQPDFGYPFDFLTRIDGDWK